MDNETARRYLRVILRWWWLVALSAIIPAGISYRLLSERPDVYQAKATLLVGSGVFEDPNPNRWDLDLSNTLAGAYSELLTRRSVLEPVIDGIGLDRSPEALAGQITTRIRPGAQLLEIQVVDLSPEAAAVIANRLAEELIRRSPTAEQSDPEQQAFIERQLGQLKDKIEKTGEQIDELTASLAELTSAAEIQEAQDRIGALEQVESRYQNAYAQLLGVSRQTSPNVLTLFEPAQASRSPLPTRNRLIAALAGAAGVALALSAVVLLEYLDTSFRWDAHGGETVLDLPVLGAIPSVSTKGPIRQEDALNPAAEGVRAIRSKLFLMRPDDFFQTLVLTSPGESEGKSFVLAYLAMALASGGNRVIAVDGDMRRPSLHEFFDRPNRKGLADVLGSDGLDPWEPPVLPVQHTDFDGLQLLTAGRPPDDPAALLTSPRFRRLLSWLTEEADVILIDTPPVLGPPDATVAATRAEGTILVVSTGLTKRESARQARDLLAQQAGVNLLGLAVNRAKSTMGYEHYYSYGSDRQERLSRWTRWAKPHTYDGLLTVEEAATQLGVSSSQARRWCRTGRLPATRRWLLWWEVDADGLDRVIRESVAPEWTEMVGAAEADRTGPT